MNYLIERLKEPSTYRGIVLIITAFGAKISPEQTEAIVSTGLLIAGFIGALTKG